MSDFLQRIREDTLERLRHQPKPHLIGRKVEGGMVVWKFDPETEHMAGAATVMADHAAQCPCGGHDGVPCPPGTWQD